MDWFIHYLYIGAIVLAWNRRVVRDAAKKKKTNIFQTLIASFVLIIIWPAWIAYDCWEDE